MVVQNSYQKMPNDSNIWEPENPKKIYDDLIKRCKQAKYWNLVCVVDEAWVIPDGKFPFDMIIQDGLYYIGIVAPTMREAMVKVLDFVPVVQFVDIVGE